MIGICNNEEILCHVDLNGERCRTRKSMGAAFVSARYHAASVIWNAII